MFKFLEDEHINVSKMINDGAQEQNSMILLDIAGPGPQHSTRPGSIKFFNPQTKEITRTKDTIELAHS